MTTVDSVLESAAPAIILAEIGISIHLATDLGVEWTLTDARVREALNEPYACSLDIVASDPTGGCEELLGARGCLTLTRGDRVRRFHGIVARVEDRHDTDDGRSILRILVVPEIWLLGQRVDSRIFSGLDAIEIIREVVRRAGLYPDEGLDIRVERGPQNRCKSREYCVQYRETDLAFVSRLLEEEGLTYFFEQGEERERLVIADGAQPAAYPELGTFDLVAEHQRALRAHESITRFERHSEVRPGSMTVHDLDFTNYTLRESARAERTTRDQHHWGAVYEHPGRYWLDNAHGSVGVAGGSLSIPIGIPVPLPQHGGHDGPLVAAARLQEIRAHSVAMHGVGNVTAFAPGASFRLEHERAQGEHDYLLAEVIHEIHADDVRTRPETSTYQDRYSNRYRAMPRSIVHRPRRVTPRPQIHGTQTATVVGGPGEEVHVDAYGRVRTQFHWDREHHCERNFEPGLPVSSPVPGLGAIASGVNAIAGVIAGGTSDAVNPAHLAWVRVSQSWAGPQWGSCFIPRVGMEVVVTFLDGDPDRPLVVGCVYNNVNPPPYPHPGEYHKSTIRSRSVPAALKLDGREGFNELRFDDLSNQEEIWLHAERNLLENVRNDHSTWVGSNQDNLVWGYQTNTVHGSQHEKIVGSQSVNLGGDQTVTTSSGRFVSVALTETHHVGGGRFTEVRAFQAQRVHGLNVHLVTPETDAAEPAEARSAMRQIDRLLNARQHDVALDPYTGTSKPLMAEGPREGFEDDDRGASGDPPALETYVVAGRRHKVVADREVVSLGARSCAVRGDDSLTVGGDYSARAGTSVSLSVTGDRMRQLKGITLQSEPPRVNLYMGGDGVRIEPSSLLIKRKDTRIRADDDGLATRVKSGAITLYLGDDDTDYGITIDDEGETIGLKTKQGTDVRVTDDLVVRAVGKVRLTNGSASIEIGPGGVVKITGAQIELHGAVSTFAS